MKNDLTECGHRPGQQPEHQPGRNENDNDFSEASPTDENADEKVIVNAIREDKTYNTPSQTPTHINEVISKDEDAIDNS